MTEANRKHERSLDGVRGFAILAVILFHSALIPIQNVGDKVLHGLTLSGWAGVDLFFVLSGFLITRILIQTKETNHFFFNFYARRILRIFPLYYFFLILTFYVFPQGVSFGFTYWTFLSNILVARLGHFQSPVLDITWSLAVEEQFYLLWPMVVWTVRKDHLAKVTVVLFLLSLIARIVYFASGANPMNNYVLLICRMDSLCAGAWLATRLNSLSSEFFRQLFFVMLIIVFGFFSWDVGLDSPSMRTVGFSANAVLAAALIGCLCKKEFSLLNSLFENKFLRVCGKYSFGMYLFHVPIIQILFSKGESLWKALENFFGAGLPAQMFFHLASIGTTLGIAMILYHSFEKHFLKLKRHFEEQPKLVSPMPT